MANEDLITLANHLNEKAEQLKKCGSIARQQFEEEDCHIDEVFYDAARILERRAKWCQQKLYFKENNERRFVEVLYKPGVDPYIQSIFNVGLEDAQHIHKALCKTKNINSLFDEGNGMYLLEAKEVPIPKNSSDTEELFDYYWMFNKIEFKPN